MLEEAADAGAGGLAGAREGCALARGGAGTGLVGSGQAASSASQTMVTGRRGMPAEDGTVAAEGRGRRDGAGGVGGAGRCGRYGTAQKL